jgi:phospholipase C
MDNRRGACRAERRPVIQHLNRLSGRYRLRHRDAAEDGRRLPDPSLPAGTDRLPQIRHIVLLMMENHSFDNYLGTSGRGDGLSSGGPPNRRADGSVVEPFHLPSTVQHRNVPSQSWRASHLQYDGGANDGFVRAIEQLEPAGDPSLAMGHWDADDLPFYADLARTFPVADRWFSSCLGPTFPNRRFLLSGTANGLIDDLPASIIDYPRSGTIFDLLNRHGITWANYHHVPPMHLLARRVAGSGGLRAVRAGRLALGRLGSDVDRQLRKHLQCSANLYPLGLLRTLVHLHHISAFFRHAASGTLPAVSIVDPDFMTCSEENPQDVQVGEGFAARVIDAVIHGPAWPHTLLIWFYDEHGGYYDHVPPPVAVEPDDVAPHSLLDVGGPAAWLLRHMAVWREVQRTDSRSGRYDRYGFRVPAVVVSPYAKREYVSHTTFDHTSALKLIEDKWNLPPLTRRDAAASAPWDMVDLGAPQFLEPPTLAAPARPWDWAGGGSSTA